MNHLPRSRAFDRRDFGLFLGFAVLVMSLTLFSTFSRAESFPASRWSEDPSARASLELAATRETALSFTGAPGRAEVLRLALKRYARPGAQPVLLVHGLAQNDRGWDSTLSQYSFARFLHSRGFDVWLGNCRNAGTPGFRSETPEGPHRWTVENYAIEDMPALIQRVQQKTGQRPFVIGHSLAAWAMEGYLAGLHYLPDGTVAPDFALGAYRQRAEVRGFVSIAGVHNAWWPHSVDDAVSNPVLSAQDYYQSNYELELLARSRPIFWVTPYLPELPLGWLNDALFLPLGKIPFVGAMLENLYAHVQRGVIQTPILSMFFYPADSDPEMVRQHVRDGMHDLGPRLTEQLANVVREKKSLSHYAWGARPENAYEYASVRSHVTIPMLFVGGTKDRLANVEMIYRDGYLGTRLKDKTFITAEAGHLDIQAGKNAPEQVMDPVARWMIAR